MGWFQVLGAVLFALFSAFNFFRCLVNGQSVVYLLCFAVMFLLAVKLGKISIAEIREAKEGGK